MHVSTLVLVLLVSYALVFVLQEGKLPSIIDEQIGHMRLKYHIVDRLFECPFCLGFWTGIASYTAFHYTQGLNFGREALLLTPFIGLASSASCYILNQITLIGEEETVPSDLAMILEDRLQHNSSLQESELYEDTHLQYVRVTGANKEYDSSNNGSECCCDGCCDGCCEIDDVDDEDLKYPH